MKIQRLHLARPCFTGRQTPLKQAFATRHPLRPATLPAHWRRPFAAVSLGLALGFLTAAGPLGATTFTWTQITGGNASGSWGAAANWNGGAGPVADGADNTADFGTLDLTALSTVTLDGARTIGNLIFGDTTPSANWVLATGTAGPLTLAVSSGSPTITANAGTSNTITAVLAGVSGLTKAGDGTLRLNGANPNLLNLLFVSAGIMQIGNATAVGTNGNHTSNDRMICTNGGTIQMMAGFAPNNKHLTLAGSGVGGTLGALYAIPGNDSNTRWGLSNLNASGTSANSSAAFPAISLAGDTTIGIDGDYVAQPNSAFLAGHISGTNNTLIKTGGGRISFERGLSGITNLLVQGGGFTPNQASSFGSIQTYTVSSGAAIWNNQNNCFSSTANLQINAGGTVDFYWRADVQTYTQNLGYLNGDGNVVAGSRTGAGGTTTLAIQGSASNSVFNGSIISSNNVRFNITKSGTATLTLNGNTAYSGLTTLSAGGLFINGTNAGLGGYLLTAGTFGGKGTLASAITNNGATLIAGDPAIPGSKMTVLSNIIGSFADTLVISNASLAVSGFIGPNFQTVGTLAMTNGTLEIPLRTLGASVFAYSLQVDGNMKLKFTMDTPLLGQFPLISYGLLGGLAGFSGLSLVSPPGITATLVDTGSSIDVKITAIPAMTWEGLPANVWNVGVANWKGGATYSEPGGTGPFVVFDDTALGSTAVSLGGTLSPQGVTVNNNSLSYSFSGSGKLSGSGGIAKQGSGTLTVANQNSLTGGINLQQGILQLGTGGNAGDVGSGPIANLGTLALNRSDSFTLANTLSGNGSITKAGAGTVTVPFTGDSSGAVTVNGGILLLGPAGTTRLAGDVTGPGAFGVNGPGTVVLNGFNNTYSGGTLIDAGTLQFGDEFSLGVLPPAGNITDNGTLATTLSGTLANSISGPGGLSILNSAAVTLSGANTYSGTTLLLGGTLDATSATYPAGSLLALGSQTGTAEIGTLNFSAGNLVLGGLRVGGNSATASAINLTAGGQTVAINGNLIVGNPAPSGALVSLTVPGTGTSITVNTNGGLIQLGLGAFGFGVNPDQVVVDFSTANTFVANLGATGLVNLGTLDGNPGPPTGATVLNQLKLAAGSNSITAGSLVVGAGGRQLIPELRLGAGVNRLNVNNLTVGGGGRDGGYLLFDGATGSLRLRANDGASRAAFNVGVNPATGTGASITNTVDLLGHPADLSISTLVIGNYNNAGYYINTFSFDQGTLDAMSTSLSVLRNNNANAAGSLSILNIGGGTASLGPVSLTASAAPGTLSITGGSVSVRGISDTGAGSGTLQVSGASLASVGALGTAANRIDVIEFNNATLSVGRSPGYGNPTTALVNATTLNLSAVSLALTGTNYVVGTFPLLSYATLGGSGFVGITTFSPPPGVAATLVDNSAAKTIDVNITAAPPLGPKASLTATPGPGTLDLKWTDLGMILQTNSVSVASPASWFPYAGSTSVTNLNLPVDLSKTNVFFRLVYP